MKKYEDLIDNTADIKQIQKTLEIIFSSNVKSKSDVNKSFEITEEQYSIVNSDYTFAQNYTQEFGYNITLFYDKVMYDRKFFIKFTIDK